MKILFLSNNPSVSNPLYEWLKASGEDVVYDTEPITVDYINRNSIEYVISYNYVHIIKRDVIALLPHRIINLHISLLPYNRGSDPNIWSFIENTPAGVTIHEIDDGIDTGGILLQERIDFDPSKETLRSSYEKLHQMIQKLFKDNWYLLKSQGIKTEPNGEGTLHKKKEAHFFEPVLNYDDIVSEFLLKVQALNYAVGHSSKSTINTSE